MPALRVAARFVLPVTSPPVEGGAVLVGAHGRISAVGRDRDVPRPQGVPALDVGDAALLPGLVNAHSHVELTALRGLVRDRPFHRWVTAVRRLRDALGPADLLASARWGVLEGFAAGITCTGDTGSSGAAAAALAGLGARGVAFQEVFGPDPSQAADSLAGLEAALESLRAHASERVRTGISPHAPYTVSQGLLEAVGALAERRGLRVAMHLAESPEEDSFVRHGTGPFADAHRSRGIPVVAHGVSPVGWAAVGGVLTRRALLIHLVVADGDDLGMVARAGASVAHCPWSNLDLGHGRADLPGMLRLGIRVGLGTDSVAAGGGLDLFREARLASAGLGLTPRETLALATRGSADALGLDRCGRLESGSQGDLCAVSLDSPASTGCGEAEAAVALAASPRDVLLTVVGGSIVYRDRRWPSVDAAAARAALEDAAARARAALPG